MAMALTPLNEIHKAQIAAGTLGRNKGHTFEKELTSQINAIDWSKEQIADVNDDHLFLGHPPMLLISYVQKKKGYKKIERVRAWWLGGLATSGEGDVILGDNGKAIGKSKSDILLEITSDKGVEKIGVSVKTCNKTSPTNDQLYFTTASAFSSLLRSNGIQVSTEAEHAMKMFCGDAGFRPLDLENKMADRKSDQSRWFFEELPEVAKKELIVLFTKYQNDITRILLQKAYLGDPFSPEFLLHQTKTFSDYNNCEVALFTLTELIELSAKYNSFWTKPYMIRKGSHKGDPSVHEAPRFGFIQFQRGGQKQHPTQLQFNLEAGYFYKLPTVELKVISS